MAITMELLDHHHEKTDFTLVVGENILLKFVPNNNSPLEQRPKLKEIISIKNLPKSEKLSWIKEIIKLSKNLKNALGEYVQEYSNKRDIEVLKNHKEKIKKISDEISDVERTIELSLCDIHQMTFCLKCNAYVGEIDSLVTKCSECNDLIKEEGKISVWYLDKISNTFFDGGIWFEDYMYYLLQNEGWKVWVHGSVMGNSGVLHPIDILAVKDNKVLIAECKTGMISPRDISHFMIQKIDIPSHFGLFLSFQSCSNKNTANLFKISTSTLVDGIEGKTDEEIMDLINKHIGKFK